MNEENRMNQTMKFETTSSLNEAEMECVLKQLRARFIWRPKDINLKRDIEDYFN